MTPAWTSAACTKTGCTSDGKVSSKTDTTASPIDRTLLVLRVYACVDVDCLHDRSLHQCSRLGRHLHRRR
eukprot:scaffold40909_cov372-Skeletonema_dohrnii-CCMP3373.AAC.1